MVTENSPTGLCSQRGLDGRCGTCKKIEALEKTMGSPQEDARLSNQGWEQAKVRPRRLRYAAFDTPDIEKALAYYLEVTALRLVDRTKDRAHLAPQSGQVSIELVSASHPRCAALGFELDPAASLNETGRSLSTEGVTSEGRTDAVPGIAEILSMNDPNGTRIDLFSAWKDIGLGAARSGIAPLKLGHVAFFTPDPQKMADFYRRVLGFRVSDWLEDFFVFMRCGPDHHSVNFLRGPTAHIHHFAFEMRDASHLVAASDVLAAKEIPLVWGPARLGPGHNLASFHLDADGHNVELFAELDQMNDEALGYFEPRPWHKFRPQRPRVWAMREDPVWGPPPPPSFLKGRG